MSEAEQLARRAGDVLLPYYGRLHRADAARKAGARRDLVSEADVAAEKELVAHIPAADDILGEEGSERDTGARRRWIVDPLDGTVNFLHGIPFWAVSVALVEDGVLQQGVVHAPALGWTFAAVRGEGATLNDEPMRVSSTGALGDAIVATGFAYRRNELADHNFDNFESIGMEAAGVRRLGAAAVDLALVASGRIDGFWELHLNAWDVAAGILLVREAGGRVTGFEGDESLDPLLDEGHIVATNGFLHEELRGKLHTRRAR
ncbi:MAG: inositol monophosphatase family protein [Planctomycetota bacterium]